MRKNSIKKNSLIQKKDNYITFLSQVGPFISPALEIAAVVSPSKAITAKLFVDGLNMILNSADDSKSQEIKRVYIPIGNFFFLNEDKKITKVLQTFEFNDVISALDILKDVNIHESLESHKLRNYRSICCDNECYNIDKYPPVMEVFIPDSEGAGMMITEQRTVDIWNDFRPQINSTIWVI